MDGWGADMTANASSSVGGLGADPTNYYPAAGTPIQSSSGNQANVAAVVTMPAVAGKTNYLAGILITSAGATAAAVVSVTITGTLGGTITQTYVCNAGATVGNAPLQMNFNPPIPATGPNVAITVTLPALGAGNTNATVTAFGFQV